MGLFPTTQWGLVLGAGRDPGTESRASLETLCGTYWYPLYAYARVGGRDPDRARDLTQGFFAHLLERDLVGLADPDRGSFRSFLKATFDHYVANERRKERAQKRGAGEAPITLDTGEAESRLRRLGVEDETPEVAYERHWARTLLAKTLEALERKMTSAGEGDRFRLLSPLLTGRDDGRPYRELASELQISESAVKVAVHRLRRRFGAVLREEVAQTVDGDDRVDAELRHVLRVLGG